IMAVVAFAPLSMSVAQTSKSKSNTQQKNKTPEEDVDKQDEQTLKLGTQLVTVPFNVTDKKNAYINGLSKDDIEVLEDNKPQQVFSFERQTDLPITIAMLIDISGSQQWTLGEERSEEHTSELQSPCN